MEQKRVGEVSVAVSLVINRPEFAGKQIYIGDSNIAHMKNAHPDDYLKYSDRIEEIIAAPDYVGLNKKDDSIEYVKEYYINGDYIKLAVRATTTGVFYARSLYTLNRGRVNRFVANGTLIPLT